jgi:hypothetical protein
MAIVRDQMATLNVGDALEIHNPKKRDVVKEVQLAILALADADNKNFVWGYIKSCRYILITRTY